MTVRSIPIGNAVVSHWSQEISVADVQKALEASQKAHSRFGPIVGIAILGADLKRPSTEILQKMAASHPEMRSYHRSIHYVLLVKGFVASSLMSVVTQALSVGTGGRLHYHSSVEAALKQSEDYGSLEVGVSDMLGLLKRAGFPLERG